MNTKEFFALKLAKYGVDIKSVPFTIIAAATESMIDYKAGIYPFMCAKNGECKEQCFTCKEDEKLDEITLLNQRTNGSYKI